MGTAGNAPLAFWVWFHAADSLASRLWLLLRRGRAPPGSLRALRRGPVPPLLAMLATLLVLLPTEASLPRRGRCPVGVCARMGSCLVARCEDRRRPEEEEARIGAGDAGGAPKTLLEPRVGAGGAFSSANQRRSCISSRHPVTVARSVSMPPFPHDTWHKHTARDFIFRGVVPSLTCAAAFWTSAGSTPA